MDPVALASREHSDLFLLIGSREIKPGNISARVNGAASKLDSIPALRDSLPDALFGIKRLPALLNVSQLHRVTQSDRSRVRLFLARYHSEQGSLSGAVWPDHPDDA